MIKYLIPFLLVFTVVTAYSQKVKGKITDIEGNPLPFASVFIKNTGKGTNANSEGVYSLKLAAGKYTLARGSYFKKRRRPCLPDYQEYDKEKNLLSKSA